MDQGRHSKHVLQLHLAVVKEQVLGDGFPRTGGGRTDGVAILG